MFEKVKKVLVDTLMVDPKLITLETNIATDLKADSLSVVELLFNLEEETGIVIPDDLVDKMTNVGFLVDYLEKNAK